MSKARGRFTVDTHLFRELGELLVGRDSTALVELVKNSYDADATQVTVHAEGLASPEKGFILIKDDGIGMTRQRFVEGFLRIASRMKENGPRLSPRLKRRYTGAKGIGRLAAHKLARILEIESVAVDAETGVVLGAFRAVINWNLVEKATTLDKISGEAVQINNLRAARTSKGGTTLVLRGLRRAWSERETIRFVQEAKRTIPPDFLTKPISGNLVDRPLLFDRVHQYSGIGSGANKIDWKLDLMGEFDVGEEFFESVADAASWVVEVDAAASRIKFGITPTKRYAAVLPEASTVIRSLDERVARGYPKFQARILVREGDWDQASEAAKRWRNSASGVMVYLEGFRVLPYGERGNDWLSIDKSYSERKADPAVAGLFDEKERKSRSGFSYLPSRAYLGGVFLTLAGSGRLKMLINREGFLPDEHFAHIQNILGKAIAFATRVRSEAKATQKADRRLARSSSAKRSATPIQRLEQSVADGLRLLRTSRSALAERKIDELDQTIMSVERALEAVSISGAEIRDQQVMVLTLASLGTQMATFVHEITGLMGLARVIELSMHELLNEGLPGDKRNRVRLAQVLGTIQDLRQALERQAAYLTDVASADARRRRSLQPFSKAFDSAVNLLAHHALLRNISIRNEIPADLKSPPMFKAEIIAVFTNLLSNAIKSAGVAGRIRATGSTGPEGPKLRIENTGVAVDPADGEKWFRPFASTTANVDPALGQGMGLGLTITRRMLDEYGADVKFVKPSRGYSTSLDISFPR